MIKKERHGFRGFTRIFHRLIIKNPRKSAKSVATYYDFYFLSGRVFKSIIYRNQRILPTTEKKSITKTIPRPIAAADLNVNPYFEKILGSSNIQRSSDAFNINVETVQIIVLTHHN